MRDDGSSHPPSQFLVQRFFKNIDMNVFRELLRAGCILSHSVKAPFLYHDLCCAQNSEKIGVCAGKDAGG